MNEIERIEDQLRRAFSGDAWYGDSLSEILTGVSAEKAVAHPVPNVHSILEIVLHLAFTQDVMRRRIEGEDAAINEGEDLFEIKAAGEAEWQDAVEKLNASHRQLLQVIGNLNQHELHSKIVNRDHTVYFLLEGLIQHLTYHAGQIALLKRA